MNPTPPVRSGAHHLTIQVYSGWDAILLPLLPRKFRLRQIARKILRHHGSPKQVSPGDFTFSIPGETVVYEITSSGGYVRPFSG